MKQTRTQRIHQGFHRVGIVVSAIVFMISGSIAFAVRAEFDKAAEVVFISVVVAAAVYGLFRAVGWVLAGFWDDQLLA